MVKPSRSDDRLHDFNISANYKISEKWDVSALWVFGTGFPVTIAVEKYLAEMSHQGNMRREIYYYPSLDNCKLPDYHRLDLGFHYKTHNRCGENILSFDIFNVYNRKNPINVYYNIWYFAYNHLLPIIPSVTYTLKF